MILRFLIACKVSTIPKSPPKIIREKYLYWLQESQFFLCYARNKGRAEARVLTILYLPRRLMRGARLRT